MICTYIFFKLEIVLDLLLVWNTLDRNFFSENIEDVKVDPTGSLCQTNTEKINLTIWGEFTHNACIKLRPKNKCGYKLFSVFITTVDRSHNKITSTIT